MIQYMSNIFIIQQHSVSIFFSGSKKQLSELKTKIDIKKLSKEVKCSKNRLGDREKRREPKTDAGSTHVLARANF